MPFLNVTVILTKLLSRFLVYYYSVINILKKTVNCSDIFVIKLAIIGYFYHKEL